MSTEATLAEFDRLFPARLGPDSIGLAELHVHVGGSVDPATMWAIAHEQGIRLPTKDYWEFVDLISLQRSFQANARVITTSDGLLNDLINIVR